MLHYILIRSAVYPNYACAFFTFSKYSSCVVLKRRIVYKIQYHRWKKCQQCGINIAFLLLNKVVYFDMSPVQIMRRFEEAAATSPVNNVRVKAAEMGAFILKNFFLSRSRCYNRSKS